MALFGPAETGSGLIVWLALAGAEAVALGATVGLVLPREGLAFATLVSGSLLGVVARTVGFTLLRPGNTTEGLPSPTLD